MKAILKVIVYILIVSSVFVGCMNPNTDTSESNPEEEKEPGGITYAAELFEDEEINGGEHEMRFYTNDPNYWALEGKSVWTVWGGESSLTEGREVTLRKQSGSRRAGYGLVLCQGKRAYKGREVSTMLVVMLNTIGHYSVGKVIGNRYEEMIPWTSHQSLEAGTGPENRVAIHYEAGRREYVLELNGDGEAIIRFKDEHEPIHEGEGKNGYVVVIAPEDTFPQDHVDVRFRERR